MSLKVISGCKKVGIFLFEIVARLYLGEELGSLVHVSDALSPYSSFCNQPYFPIFESD